MKNTLLIINLFLTSLVFCQNFPGKDVELILNKELKVLPKDEKLQKYGYSDFYKDESLKNKYECCESYNSKYLSLVNKVF